MKTFIDKHAHKIKPGTAWNIFALKQKFAWDVGIQQIKHTTRQETQGESEI